MAELKVSLVAMDRQIWVGEARMVVATTPEGEIGILPGHEPVLALLVDGPVRIETHRGREDRRGGARRLLLRGRQRGRDPGGDGRARQRDRRRARSGGPRPDHGRRDRDQGRDQAAELRGRARARARPRCRPWSTRRCTWAADGIGDSRAVALSASRCTPRSPPGCHRTSPGFEVRVAGQDEQQVGEPVEVAWRAARSSARRARPMAAQVARSARRTTVRATCRCAAAGGAAGQHERPQRRAGARCTRRTASRRSTYSARPAAAGTPGPRPPVCTGPRRRRRARSGSAGGRPAPRGRARRRRARRRSRSWPRPRRRRRPGAGRSWTSGSCRPARSSRRRRCGCRCA